MNSSVHQWTNQSNVNIITIYIKVRIELPDFLFLMFFIIFIYLVIYTFISVCKIIHCAIVHYMTKFTLYGRYFN